MANSIVRADIDTVRNANLSARKCDLLAAPCADLCAPLSFVSHTALISSHSCRVTLESRHARSTPQVGDGRTHAGSSHMHHALRGMHMQSRFEPGRDAAIGRGFQCLVLHVPTWACKYLAHMAVTIHHARWSTGAMLARRFPIRRRPEATRPVAAYTPR